MIVHGQVRILRRRTDHRHGTSKSLLQVSADVKIRPQKDNIYSKHPYLNTNVAMLFLIQSVKHCTVDYRKNPFNKYVHRFSFIETLPLFNWNPLSVERAELTLTNTKSAIKLLRLFSHTMFHNATIFSIFFSISSFFSIFFKFLKELEFQNKLAIAEGWYKVGESFGERN